MRSEKLKKRARGIAHLLGPRGERKLAGGEDVLSAIVHDRGCEHLGRDLGLEPFNDLQVETGGERFFRRRDN